MQQPEMSYSPAYRQAQDPLGAARSVLTASTRQSLEQPELSYSDPSRPSSTKWSGHLGSPHASGSRISHPCSPGAPLRESRLSEDAIAVTRILASSGAAHKEDRSRGSWADQPSSMSVEQSGTFRSPKRGASIEESASYKYDEDAPLMLVSSFRWDEYLLYHLILTSHFCSSVFLDLFRSTPSLLVSILAVRYSSLCYSHHFVSVHYRPLFGTPPSELSSVISSRQSSIYMNALCTCGYLHQIAPHLPSASTQTMTQKNLPW